MPTLSQAGWDRLVERWNRNTTIAERLLAARDCAAQGHQWARIPPGGLVCRCCLRYDPEPE